MLNVRTGSSTAVLHTDPWLDPTRSKSRSPETRWHVTRRPGSISGAAYKSIMWPPALYNLGSCSYCAQSCPGPWTLVGMRKGAFALWESKANKRSNELKSDKVKGVRKSWRERVKNLCFLVNFWRYSPLENSLPASMSKPNIRRKNCYSCQEFTRTGMPLLQMFSLHTTDWVE